jgi:hypothetical protein
LETDVSEATNLVTKHPEIVSRLTDLLKKYIADGRSTPGAVQPNDEEVPLYPKRVAKKKGKA